LALGDPADPRWVRPALWSVVALSAVLYLWQLDISGFANEYYSAAAQAASQSWSALFFGALDASGFITVDKPPAALWLLGLSVRLFGLSPWSILLPQAICGIATVVVLYLTARRSFGPAAGIVAALVLALTPVAVLIFRYDNPDALLTLLLVSAAWATVRAIEDGRTRWIVLAGVLVGFAFLTKYLQAFIVLPALAVAVAVAAPGDRRRRAGQLLVAAVTVALASGWWVIVVEALPIGARPHIGGSEKDSVLDLLLGYDGLGRLFGATSPGGGGGIQGFPTGGPTGPAPGSLPGIAGGGAPGGGPGGIGGGPGGPGGFGGAAGPLRMFNAEWGGQVAWLIPAAVVAAVGGIVAAGRSPRTDPARAGFLLWGTWLAAHLATFSLASGIVHPYYAVVIAPAVGALVGGGLAAWWRVRERRRVADVILAATALVTAGVAAVLLARTPDFLPWLPAVAVAAAVGGAGLVLVSGWLPRGSAAGGRGPGRSRSVALLGAALTLVAGLVAPAAYAIETTTQAYGGGDPSAGPATAGGLDGGRDGSVGRGAAGVPGADGSGGAPWAADGSGVPGDALGLPGGASGLPGGASGLPGDGTDEALIAFLLEHRGSARWIVAAQSANAAAPIQLATGAPVMAMGGFSGSDPWPTADELASLVATGDLRYVLAGGLDGRGGFGGPGGVGPSGVGPSGVGPGGVGGSDRTTWVQATCSTVDYGGSAGTLYDCAPEAGPGG
jgi:4-amino-4-deoxy-L-arabinose transferase-like glycosyltransferase